MATQRNGLPMKRKTPEVSKKLTLFDDTWPTENRNPYAKELSEANIKERAVARKIAAMKTYRHGEEEAEKQKGVSTKLELYLDPWIIKKKLMSSDVGPQCRLMLQKSSVTGRVLPLMDVDSVNKIADDGLLVIVDDQDTHSQHQLTLKQYASSTCYVLNGDWNRDFVKRRNLKVGDEVGLYWDPNSSRFNFCVLNRAPTIQQ